MKTIDRLRRSGIAITPDRTIRDAAVLMEQSGIGCLAVLDAGELVGVVTDRDLVRRGLARGVPGDARVDSVMSSPVVTISADADVHDAFRLFRQHAVRRLVVTRADQFVGVVSLDDFLVELASDLSDLARPVTAELLFGHHDSPLPVATQ